MKVFKLVNLLSVGVIALVVAGCGGGSSSSGGSVSPTPPGPQVIDSGSVYPYPNGNMLYQIEGNTFYYHVDNCVLPIKKKVDFKVYADHTMKVDNDSIDDTCVITKKFVPHTAVDGNVNAVHINYSYYYDNSSKLYYLTSGPGYVNGKIVKIINNGQNVIIEFAAHEDKKLTLYSVVEEVPLDS